MSGGERYDRAGWKGQLKHETMLPKPVEKPDVATAEELDTMESGKGVDGEVLRQYTTVAMYHPEWMNGMSMEQAVKMCRDECISRWDCGGVQVILRPSQDLDF